MPGPDDRALMFLGLATRAGKTVSGDEACRAALKKGLTRMLIVSEDASQGTKDKFKALSETFSTGYRVFGTKDGLSRFTGRPDRKVVAVNDEGFAARLTELIDEAAAQEARPGG